MPNKVTKVLYPKISYGCYATLTKNLKKGTRKIKIFDSKNELVSSQRVSENPSMPQLAKKLEHCLGSALTIKLRQG